MSASRSDARARDVPGEVAELSMAEVARHDGRGGSLWTVIEGEVYDISEFARDHPGGSIIRLAAGQQADALLESYHSSAATRRVRAVLRRRARHVGSLRPEDRAPRGDPAFFTTVRARVEQSGSTTPKSISFGEINSTDSAPSPLNGTRGFESFGSEM